MELELVFSDPIRRGSESNECAHDQQQRHEICQPRVPNEFEKAKGKRWAMALRVTDEVESRQHGCVREEHDPIVYAVDDHNGAREKLEVRLIAGRYSRKEVAVADHPVHDPDPRDADAGVPQKNRQRLQRLEPHLDA